MLGYYAYQYLNEKDRKLFDKLFDENKEFCEIFGPDKIGSNELVNSSITSWSEK